ncbi:metal ABC transporter permease [Thermovibrio ammonificans]
MFELHNPLEFLAYDFGVKALFASVFAGITCSALGSYVVIRRMSFAGAGLAHVAFAGVAFGFLVGISPLLSALLFSLVAAVVIWYLQERKNLHFDVGMGVIFATSMAVAVIAMSFSGVYGSQVLSYLFGSPLAVEWSDLLSLFLLFTATAAFIALYWRELWLTVFSAEIAKASGYRVELITLLLNLLVAAVVTLSMRAVGALLVFSLLVVPAASAYRLSKSFKGYFLLSVAFGFLSGLLGILVSFTLDAPSGASITIVAFLLFLVAAVMGE